MSFNFGKRGGVGKFLVMFWATILIVFILTIFVLSSGFIKKVQSFDKDAAGAGVYIYDESRVGIDDIFNYVLDYDKLVEAKYLVAGGMDLETALQEVGYE